MKNFFLAMRKHSFSYGDSFFFPQGLLLRTGAVAVKYLHSVQITVKTEDQADICLPKIHIYSISQVFITASALHM